MKLRILLSISIFMLSHSVFAVIVDKLQDYSWKPLKVGAGGFVTGMYIHPNEANLMYVRTDVSGAYRWDPANSVWKQLVTSESMPVDFSYYATYGGVTSIAGAPTDANIVYMAYQNRIFKSVDKGDTWTVTAFLENMDSNGDGRQEGERIVVDPHNSNLVYYGSVGNGLFRTEDGGAKWNRVTGIPVGRVNHGVNTIVFDKKSGTTNSKTKTIYVTVDGEGVYQSKDAGISWIKLVDTDIVRPAPRDAEIGPDGTYYVAYTNETGSKGAVKKYVNNVWVNITPNVGSSPYNDIAVEPNNGQQIVVISSGGSTWSSNNQGQNWTTKYEHFILQSPNIEWMGKQVTSWLSIGEILFDPHDSGKLWFAEGFGVWWTKDLGQYDYGVTWIEESRGIEETCGNTVVCPPGGKPITAQA